MSATVQSPLHFRRLLVVIKQTAYEQYSLLRARGVAPKAVRWKRLEDRYKTHNSCVNDLLGILRRHRVEFSCINRVELDRQHLANVDLVVSVGGDGTMLSAAHFIDHGTIPILGINSDPIRPEDRMDPSRSVKTKGDERRSHGALCTFTSSNMAEEVPKILYGGGTLSTRTRISCVVKSTFFETRLVPALNDLLIAIPSPAAVSRFRMGWLGAADAGGVVEDQRRLEEQSAPLPHLSGPLPHSSGTFPESFGSSSSDASNSEQEVNGQDAASQPRPSYGTVTRFNGMAYNIKNSLNVWSSGIWICTATGSTAAMAAAGGMKMPGESRDLQYLIREHMIEKGMVQEESVVDMNNALLEENELLHLRWNSQQGRIFIDGPHLTHDLELGDEVMISSNAPPLQMFVRDSNNGE